MYNLHDRELRIQGDINFSFGENSGEAIDHKASILFMFMIKANKMIVKRKKCGFPKKRILAKLVFLKKNKKIFNVVKKIFHDQSAGFH